MFISYQEILPLISPICASLTHYFRLKFILLSSTRWPLHINVKKCRIYSIMEKLLLHQTGVKFPRWLLGEQFSNMPFHHHHHVKSPVYLLWRDSCAGGSWEQLLLSTQRSALGRMRTLLPSAEWVWSRETEGTWGKMAFIRVAEMMRCRQGCYPLPRSRRRSWWSGGCWLLLQSPFGQ